MHQAGRLNDRFRSIGRGRQEQQQSRHRESLSRPATLLWQVWDSKVLPQDTQNGQTSHPPNPGGYFTRPPRVCQDSLFAQERAFSQARPQRVKGEEVQTALRVGRSPLQWVLANGKAPTAFQTSEKFLLNVA